MISSLDRIQKDPRSCLFLPFAHLFACILVGSAAFSPLYSQQAQLAATPPMGWNSWDAYGTTIKESEVKANADAMASGLKQYGWQYVVIDIQWYEPNAYAHGYRPNAQLAMDVNGWMSPIRKLCCS
jgi:alpha-galactosidase